MGGCRQHYPSSVEWDACFSTPFVSERGRSDIPMTLVSLQARGSESVAPGTPWMSFRILRAMLEMGSMC